MKIEKTQNINIYSFPEPFGDLGVGVEPPRVEGGQANDLLGLEFTESNFSTLVSMFSEFIRTNNSNLEIFSQELTEINSSLSRESESFGGNEGDE